MYRRDLRARKKLVTPAVTPAPKCDISPLSHPVTSIKNVTPVTPQKLVSESDADLKDLEIVRLNLVIKKLQVRVAFLEKSMERYAALDRSQSSTYRLGPEFRECR